MLAELAAFNAAYATVKATVSAGRELSSVMQSIGSMVDSKETLEKKLKKRKNSIFSSGVESDLDEFMALERIKEAEKELEQLMIYAGRPGLHQDWVKFQVEARKKRKQAQEAAKKKRQERNELIMWIVTGVVVFLVVFGFIGSILWYKGMIP